MQLASRLAYRAPAIRSARPLEDEEIARVVTSIFAAEAHDSRSERYTYIPTIDVLRGLSKGRFQPFMAAQTRVRNHDKREHTKHMIRLRHADQVAGREANEIILLNSHDGSSSYQMLAGMFRFVCQNAMVCGDTLADFRVPHKGDVVGQVIEGAFTVLDSFDKATEQRESMEALRLSEGEQNAFARAASPSNTTMRWPRPDRGRPTPTPPPHRGPRVRLVDDIQPRSGEHDQGRLAWPEPHRAARYNPSGQRDRSEREGQSCSLGAGGRNAKATGLTRSGTRRRSRPFSSTLPRPCQDSSFTLTGFLGRNRRPSSGRNPPWSSRSETVSIRADGTRVQFRSQSARRQLALRTPLAHRIPTQELKHGQQSRSNSDFH